MDEPSNTQLEAAFESLEAGSRDVLEQLANWAADGSSLAMIFMGRAYYYGWGVALNYLTAEQWFRRAANEGNELGNFFLGALYRDRARFEEARTEFEIAIAADYAPACHLLGRMYFYGDGVDRDLTAARTLLERAATDGNLAAKLQLAHLLKSGAFSLQDVIRGVFVQISGRIQTMAVYLREGPRSERFW